MHDITWFNHFPFLILLFRLERALLIHAGVRGCLLCLAVNYPEYVVSMRGGLGRCHTTVTGELG
jgi:hypothetical protein